MDTADEFHRENIRLHIHKIVWIVYVSWVSVWKQQSTDNIFINWFD